MSYDTYITGGGNPGYAEFDEREAPEPEENEMTTIEENDSVNEAPDAKVCCACGLADFDPRPCKNCERLICAECGTFAQRELEVCSEECLCDEIGHLQTRVRKLIAANGTMLQAFRKIMAINAEEIEVPSTDRAKEPDHYRTMQYAGAFGIARGTAEIAIVMGEVK